MQSTPVNPYADVVQKTDDPAKLTSEAIDVAYADVTVVIDRSASMVSIQQGVVDGFNVRVEEMRKTPGDNKWSLVQFDDYASARGANEAFPHVTYEGKGECDVPYLVLAPSSIRQDSCGYRNAAAWGIAPSTEEPRPVPEGEPTVTYQPRGSTALVDALCLTIDRVQVRTSGQEHRVKPVIMVVTDGQENASHQFGSVQLREKVAATQARGWEYIYLGANQDSFVEAGKYNVGGSAAHVRGLAPDATYANNFVATNAGVAQAMTSGFVGAASIASGAVDQGKLIYSQLPPICMS